MNIEKFEVEYWNPKNETVTTESGFTYLDKKSVVQKTEEWIGNRETIFRKFYDENNRLRYCNGSYFKFKDSETQCEYIEWLRGLSQNERFNMFYGNGVVD